MALPSHEGDTTFVPARAYISGDSCDKAGWCVAVHVGSPDAWQNLVTVATEAEAVRIRDEHNVSHHPPP